MGTKYSDQSAAASAYNSSPPPDDGSQVAANKVIWATHKTKLGDPNKAYSDAINTALQTTLDFSSTQQTTNYTTQLSDNMKTIEIPSGSPTISLGDATTMTKNYVVTVTNTGTGAPVIALITATDTLDGTVNGTFTFPTGAHTSFTFKVNNGAIGYYTEGVGANKGALTVNITGNASGTAATVTGAAQTAITSVGASLVWGTGVANFGAVTKRKPSDQSVTSSTVLVNDNDLSFPIAASEEWVATFKIDAGAADLTTGLKYAITVPSGASLDANTLTTYAPVGAGNSTTWGARSITSGSLLSFGGGGMTDWKITIDVWVLNGATPGNITLQFAQFSSSSIALTFRKGSFVQATRVA